MVVSIFGARSKDEWFTHVSPGAGNRGIYEDLDLPFHADAEADAEASSVAEGVMVAVQTTVSVATVKKGATIQSPK